ncbi:MAG: hypothetical protein Q9160_004293 [Pyrenula sp. 1 TL-2023]
MVSGQETAQLTIVDNDSSESESEPESSVKETNDDRLNRTIQGIASSSKCLMSLLPSLQRAARLLFEAPPARAVALDVPLHVSDPAHSFMSQVMDKFVNIDVTLAQRLGRANWERHRRLLKQMHFDSSLDEARANYEDGEGRGEKTIQVEAQYFFHKTSTFRDSGIGSSRPKQSSYAMSKASHTSFRTDINNDTPGGLRVPETPQEVGFEMPFQCEIRGHMLYNIMNRIDWK